MKSIVSIVLHNIEPSVRSRSEIFNFEPKLGTKLKSWPWLMISCCAHYLANILPILGITGFITIVAQYQVQLFWIGLTANLAGITYMTNKIARFTKGYEIS